MSLSFGKYYHLLHMLSYKFSYQFWFVFVPSTSYHILWIHIDLMQKNVSFNLLSPFEHSSILYSTLFSHVIDVMLQMVREYFWMLRMLYYKWKEYTRYLWMLWSGRSWRFVVRNVRNWHDFEGQTMVGMSTIVEANKFKPTMLLLFLLHYFEDKYSQKSFGSWNRFVWTKEH